MKRIIDRMFARRGRADGGQAISAVSSELTHSDIEKYYLRIMTDMMRRMLISADSVEIAVRRAGVGPNGLTSFAGYVRILRWDAAMPVMLQNMPVIDARIRKVVSASVILEHTHFAGLWFQAGCTTAGAPQVLVGMPAELIRQPITA